MYCLAPVNVSFTIRKYAFHENRIYRYFYFVRKNDLVKIKLWQNPTHKFLAYSCEFYHFNEDLPFFQLILILSMS